MNIRAYFIGLCCSLLLACQQDEWEQPFGGTNGEGLQLQFSTEGLMDRYVVTSKGTDVKTPTEQEIRSLHVFIFDAEGNYLEAADAHRYQGYRTIPGGKNVLNIDRQGWAEPEKAETATVIVVANVQDGTFLYGEADQPPTNVHNRDALLSIAYILLMNIKINILYN